MVLYSDSWLRALYARVFFFSPGGAEFLYAASAVLGCRFVVCACYDAPESMLFARGSRTYHRRQQKMVESVLMPIMDASVKQWGSSGDARAPARGKFAYARKALRRVHVSFQSSPEARHPRVSHPTFLANECDRFLVSLPHNQHPREGMLRVPYIENCRHQSHRRNNCY